MSTSSLAALLFTAVTALGKMSPHKARTLSLGLMAARFGILFAEYTFATKDASGNKYTQYEIEQERLARLRAAREGRTGSDAGSVGGSVSGAIEEGVLLMPASARRDDARGSDAEEGRGPLYAPLLLQRERLDGSGAVADREGKEYRMEDDNPIPRTNTARSSLPGDVDSLSSAPGSPALDPREKELAQTLERGAKEAGHLIAAGSAAELLDGKGTPDVSQEKGGRVVYGNLGSNQAEPPRLCCVM